MIGSILSLAATSGENLESLLGGGMAMAITSNILRASPPAPLVSQRASASAAISPTLSSNDPVNSVAPNGLAPERTVSVPPLPWQEPTGLQPPAETTVLPLSSALFPPELFVQGDVDAFDFAKGFFTTMTIVKRVANGQETYFASRGFLENLISVEDLTVFVNLTAPTPPPYMHPGDAHLCAEVMKVLWEGLTPHETQAQGPRAVGALAPASVTTTPSSSSALAPGGSSTVKSCSHAHQGTRVMLRQLGFYVCVNALAQLVVISSDQGQVSYTGFQMSVPDAPFVPQQHSAVPEDPSPAKKRHLAALPRPPPQPAVIADASGSDVDDEFPSPPVKETPPGEHAADQRGERSASTSSAGSTSGTEDLLDEVCSEGRGVGQGESSDDSFVFLNEKSWDPFEEQFWGEVDEFQDLLAI